MAVFSLTSSNGFSLPMYKINNSMLHLVQSNGVSHEQGKWEHFYTFMRLVGEGTWQTRLQIKAGFLVCARRCWSACVASENKWSFQRGGKKNKKNPKHNHLLFRNILQIYHSKGWKAKVPGVFVAENDAVLTLLGFNPLAVGFCGVLEATQGDMRAGVFTSDLLYSLSWVASENLYVDSSH